MYFNQRVRIKTLSSIRFLQHLRNKSSIDPRPSTPPHHPNFGVQMSTKSIRKLVHMALPQLKLIDIGSLPSFKSYNNRIYFLKCSRPTSDANDVENEEFVLKINGRDFKGNKIAVRKHAEGVLVRVTSDKYLYSFTYRPLDFYNLVSKLTIFL